MLITSLLSKLLEDLRSHQSRFNYLNFLLSELPGEFGVKVRSLVLGKFFKSTGKGVRILQGARFFEPENLTVGDGVWIGIDNILQATAGLSIGDHTILAPGVKIWTIDHPFQSPYEPIIKQGWEYKPVTVGANVWIASNVCVMPGVEIPDGCIVSAGSVVCVKKYSPYSIIAGNPARVIGTRLSERESNPAEDVAAPLPA